MKAMVINEFGGPEVFTLAEMPDPAPRAGEVLIRVAGSSVNPIDWKMRSGAVKAIASPLPAVLHGDVSGTIQAVGEGTEGFEVGDEVYACAGGLMGLDGALGELMRADARLVARRPASLDVASAACVPLVGITAWEALVDRARIEPGMRVLVHGGTGGVGHLGVQLARLRGAVVTTTVSTEDKARVACDLGADEVVRYPEQEVDDYVARLTGGEGFDVVFDTVGGENIARSIQAARRGGTVVTIAARATQDLTAFHGKGATLHCVFMLLPMLTGRGRERHGEILARLARLIDRGRLGPLIDPQRFAFADVADAHRKLEAGQAVGKVCLEAGW
jgi:NADPH2:quinone reductase